MFRVTIASVIGVITVVAANAGSVYIGGASGITNNYIVQGAGAICAAGAGQCVTGSTTGWAEKNYDNVLFAGATGASGSPVPFAGYAQSGGESAGLAATDTTNHESFAMLADGANPLNNSSINYWSSTGAGGIQQSITVPVGVQSVTDVWTMMDNQWGSMGGNDTSVTFNFGSSSNQTSGYNSITVDLTDSNNAGNTSEMRAALACTTTTSATCNNSSNPHGALATGAVINGVTVNGGVVYNTFNYTAANGFYAGTAGKLKLDDQEFVFSPTLLGQWLVSMTITENVANNTGTGLSETALSAITVDSAAPEPTTILLLVSGLGVLGLKRFRRG